MNIKQKFIEQVMRGYEFIMPRDCLVTGLNVAVDVPAGFGESYKFTILKNGISTNMQVVLSDEAATGSDTTNYFKIKRLVDLISLRVETSEKANPCSPRCSVDYRKLRYQSSLRNYAGKLKGLLQHHALYDSRITLVRKN